MCHGIKHLLALDGDAYISPEVYLGEAGVPTTPALLCATQRSFTTLLEILRRLPIEDLQTLAEEIDEVLRTQEPASAGKLQLGDYTLRWGQQTYVMGIINLTPDSSSQDALLRQGDELTALAAAQAERFAAEGVDIIAIVCDDSSPGAQQLAIDEELRRLIPAIEHIRSLSNLPISIDTHKSQVAAKALDAGATLINDIWGLRTPEGSWNEPLARLAAERGTPMILRHNQQAQTTISVSMGEHNHDVLGQVCAELRKSVAYAQRQGIPREHIIIDPGIGFGKTLQQNSELVRRIGELRSLGLPILLGTSHKSFLGLALGTPAQEWAAGTAATTALGIAAGIDLIRVHDVAPNVQVARMTDALTRPGAWERLTEAHRGEC